MYSKRNPIGIGVVERQINDGFRWLKFERAIETQFEHDIGGERCRLMIRLNYIGLFVYHAFLITDYRSIRDVFDLDLFVHFAIMAPLMIGANLILARHPPVWVRETLESISVVILALTIGWVTSSTRAPDREIILLTIILVVLFSILMQRIRFWYVLPASFVMAAIYGICLAGFEGLSMDRVNTSISLVLGVIVFSLVGAYHLESEQRMGYLLRLRDRLRNDELQITSLKDALTGVGNRRALDLALLSATRRDMAGADRSVAVLLLDIDHFKRFNDTNGHQEGDLCLTRVAGLLAACLRDGDGQVYRFGGEEFLILLAAATLPEAILVAERIRSAVADARLSAGPSGETVTVSIGAASGIPVHGSTPQSLIADADRALYSAKAQGRNRVCSRTEDTDEPTTAPLQLRLAI